jgi:hypothetical protein
MAAAAAELELRSPAPGRPLVSSDEGLAGPRGAAREWVRWMAEHTATPWFAWSAETGELLARTSDDFPAHPGNAYLS